MGESLLVLEMKIWTSEHVFNHNWETVVQGQWQKYPNPHNQAVVGTDVVERKVTEEGVLHSHRIISSDWGLAEWVQQLIGANKVCYASENSIVDPRRRLMEMHSRNLTSSMEGIIVNTVSKNSNKGRVAIEWVVDKLGEECRSINLSASLDKLKTEIVGLKHSVAESLITPAKKSIEELQGELAKIDLKGELAKIDLPNIPIAVPQVKAEESVKDRAVDAAL